MPDSAYRTRRQPFDKEILMGAQARGIVTKALGFGARAARNYPENDRIKNISRTEDGPIEGC